MKKVILILIGSLTGAFSFAQERNVITQGAYWFRYYNQTKVGELVTLHAEIDERRYVRPDHQAQFFTHLHLHRRIGTRWDVALGMNYNQTNSNRTWSLAIPEYRPWQEVSWIHPLHRVSLQLRYRTEERFIRHNDNIQLLDGYRFTWRHRLRVQLSIPLQKENTSTSLKLSEEIMVNALSSGRTFDQNRVSISVEKSFSKKFALEIGYLNLLQARSPEGYYDRHVIRTTLYHRIDITHPQVSSGD